MHKAEKDLSKIERNFKKQKLEDKVAAKKEAKESLRKIGMEIKSAVAQMQKSSEHSALTERHKHRLNNELMRVKNVINRQ